MEMSKEYKTSSDMFADHPTSSRTCLYLNVPTASCTCQEVHCWLHHQESISGRERSDLGTADIESHMSTDDSLSAFSDCDDKEKNALSFTSRDVFNTQPEVIDFNGGPDCQKIQPGSRLSATDQWRQPPLPMDRLHTFMKISSVTQAALQDWDRVNGLPASHARTMVNTARSRKQLLEGVLLTKWNGAPLIKSTTTADSAPLTLKDIIGSWRGWNITEAQGR